MSVSKDIYSVIYNIIITIAIAILLVIVISYGLFIIYEPPSNLSTDSYQQCYQKYNCSNMLQECLSESGAYDRDCYNRIYNSEPYLQCKDLVTKCRDDAERQTPKFKYARNNFYILSAIGLLAIILGILLIKLHGIGSGLIGGGILIILWSLVYTGSYWRLMNRYIHLIVLVVVLLLLIIIAIIKLNKINISVKRK